MEATTPSRAAVRRTRYPVVRPLRRATLSRCLVGMLAAALLLATPRGREAAGEPSAGAPQLLEVRKIWDQAPHNAFTDLIRFHDRWYCVFREGSAHVSPDGALRVIVSDDGQKWEPAARLVVPGADLRDAKITVTPAGRLMLSGAAAMPPGGPVRHRSLAWFSDDGTTWSEPVPIGDPNFWLWRVTWDGDEAYSIGYGTAGDPVVRLYRSEDGRRFTPRVPRLYDAGSPSEHALLFLPDRTALCLLRRDAGSATAQLGTARPPYTHWEWKDLGIRIGGPQMIRIPDGRIVAAVRLYTPKVRTSLCWVDPVAGTLTEFLALPSGGDTSYAGLVWHQRVLWASYYSSHEAKTAVYLARVAVPDDRSGGVAGEDAAVLEAGYAEADITPPLGGSMPGYFQDRQATGVLDPLKAKVLALRHRDTTVALVACDLVGVPAPVVARIRQAVAARVHPSPVVWVHGTHSHTGGLLPRSDSFTSDVESIYPGFYAGVVNDTWVESMITATARAVAEAVDQRKPEAHLTLHEGREATVAHYRRYVMKDGSVRTNPGRANPEVVKPAGEIDPRLTVLRFGDAKIVFVLYGMHPDCVGGTRYSADYPHHMTEALRATLGREWRVFFLNTCCGNINHIDVDNPDQKSGPAESQRIGEALARAVAAALPAGRPVPVDRLQVATRIVTCRLRRPSPEVLAEAERRIKANDRVLEFNGLFATAAVVLAKTRDREHPAEIGALVLGDTALAAMPGEIFVELGRDVEAGSPFRPTRTVGLTNGAMGYIPTRKGYEEGGYEASFRSARYEPGNGENWARAAVELLRGMK